MAPALDIDRWRQALADMQADARRVSHNERTNRIRREIVPAILDLHRRFSSREISLEAFRAEFDTRTRTEWDVFGFKGMSGAMFLNKLAKHLGETDVDDALRTVLSVPSDETEGLRRMQAFETYLQAQIEAGKTTRGHLHPGRMPFLVSGFWHLQDREAWPVHYQSGRAVLRDEGLTEGNGSEPVADYFEFRSVFERIADALAIDSWTCEHLLGWLNREEPIEPPPPSLKRKEGVPPVVPPIVENEEGSHTHVQWLLAKIGKSLGCQVWVATNDRGKIFEGARLGDGCLSELPRLGLDDASQRIVQLIDVVWIKGDRQIAAAFEIEHTTSIYSGLLRMSDLAALSPNLSFPLYIVAPESRMSKVAEQLARPTFRTLELDRLCGFFSNETLFAAADGIMRWANDPSAIRRLATRVSDD